MWEIVSISLLFGLICLDQKQVFQFNISQPVFTCAFIGLWYDALIPALYFGMTIQLLWPGHLPVGTTRVPDSELAAVAGGVLFTVHHDAFSVFGHLLLLLCTLYIILLSHVMTDVNHVVFKANLHFVNAILDKPMDNTKKISVNGPFAAALFTQFITNVLMLIVAIFAGHALLNWIGTFADSNYNHLWAFVEPAIWGTGVGLIIILWRANKYRGVFLLSVILTILIMKSLV